MSELRDEFYKFDMSGATKEAERCAKCRLPKCTKACPLNLNVQKILDLIANYKMNEAYKELINRNVLAEYTSVLCKERPLCTLNCASNFEKQGFFNISRKTIPIDIPLIEDFLINFVKDNGDQILINREKSKKSVAIVGSNATGLSCALHLIFNGFRVYIYENDNVIGEDLRTGLYDVKKANEIVDNYEKVLTDFGAVIEKEKILGIDFDLGILRREHNYLVLTSTFETSNNLHIQGETQCMKHPVNDVLHLVMYANDFIKMPNREDYFKQEDKVIVIGSSTLGFDTARIVNKFTDEVDLCFETSEKYVNIRKDELDKSKLREIKIEYNIKPIKIKLVDRKVEVTFIRTRNIKDGSMRSKLEEIFDSEYTVLCDHIIIDSTIGYSLNEQMQKLTGITYDKNFKIVVDEKNSATSDNSVYVGGELIGEQKDILHSIKEGMNIAKTIIQESGGDVQEYKDQINNIIREQNAQLFSKDEDDEDE